MMELGEPDASGRRSPEPSGKTELMPVDLVDHGARQRPEPDHEGLPSPRLKTTKWGTIAVKRGSQATSIEGVFSGGDAARGGSTAIRAAGDGQAAAP